MLPPLSHEGSMLTTEQGNVDVSTASDVDASFKFKPRGHLDPNPLPPFPASLNQVPFFFVVVNCYYYCYYY